MLEVYPVPHAFGKFVPILNIGKDTLAAEFVELFHFGSSCAVIASRKPEFLLHRDFDGQTVRVPTAFARNMEALHGLVTRE